MTTEYSGRGDRARTLALLWGFDDKPRRGPRPGLSARRVVEAATELADADGLAALSMRRVAERLGAGTMSLYTYLPGKAELIDLMLDSAYGEVDLPDPPAGYWRDTLEGLARQTWAMYHRHPWMLRLTTTRPVLGPNETARYDYELRALDGLGLTDIEMDSVVSLVAGHVLGAARRAAEAAQTEQRTGMTEQQWWSAQAPLLGRIFDGGRFPTAARVGPAVGEAFGTAYPSEHAFEFGLQRVLDGIGAFIRSRSGPARESR